MIGLAQERAFRCERIGVIIAGYEVPHTHVHVIPTNSMAEVRSPTPPSTSSGHELEPRQRPIRAEPEGDGSHAGADD